MKYYDYSETKFDGQNSTTKTCVVSICNKHVNGKFTSNTAIASQESESEFRHRETL